jgi:hypothetical protein
MKDFRILALLTMLALGFTMSAQTQTENTNGSDQYTTQSTGQTASAHASSDNGSMFAQPSQGAASGPSMSNDTNSDQNREPAKAKPDLRRSEQEWNRDIQLKMSSGAE